ncbi:MAG TPA: recombination protein O N-terminal domain-containing protein, partial [Plasticicumulans sp.]|nr:recombination protein O N-terminal domain-containing protein [Plasticicumulans sp.]
MSPGLEPAWVLHTRPYRDTSLLLELLTLTRGRVGAENLQEIHAVLFGRPPMSFAELSQPGAGIEGGEAQETYRLSAELFLYQLQQLTNGRRCLQAMLANLTRAMNWQTAFLAGFEPHFGRLLDVEKWWT